MTAKKTCPDCGTEMDEGFVPQFTGGGAVEQVWYPGKPKKKYDYLDLNSSTAIAISVYRCSHCGLLRRYALENSDESGNIA